MKTAIILLILPLLGALSTETPDETKGLYGYKMNDIDGNEVPLKKFEGKVLLIVNVASECGYTPQYEGLENIYKKYRAQGFEILGFPANDFGNQEPGTNEEIKQFCRVKKGATFPMFAKIHVKGKQQAPLFEHLTTIENPDFTGDIKWNFEKFLISRDGKLLHRFRSPVKPESKELTTAIENALNK